MLLNNKLVNCFGLGLVLGLMQAAPAAHEAISKDNVSLLWAFGARPAGTEEAISIEQDTTLRSGARLKFMIEPITDSSIYLIYQDAKDEMFLLYPDSPASFGAAGPADNRSYVPPGSLWFELDDSTGYETFFLLASHEPQLELERLIEEHDVADKVSRTGLVRDIVKEIRGLQKVNRAFARKAEKPVIIGGQTRGGSEVVDEDATAFIDQIAVEIKAEGFYSKTISIEHKQ